jgi:potassium-transporting ATPase ATP-binding subunit
LTKERAKIPTVHNEKEQRWSTYRDAFVQSVIKLNPIKLRHNFVMLVVEIGSMLTTLIYFMVLLGLVNDDAFFVGFVSIWLWFTVIFANFSEALAEGRGRAQADALKKMRVEMSVCRLKSSFHIEKREIPNENDYELVPLTSLGKGDLFLVQRSDIIPADGDVVLGAASVDESAITGESAPVIREAGGDCSAVTGGTKILSDWLVVKVSNDPGDSFVDRMIGLIEGAKRKKTPNEIALDILLIGLTVIFLIICIVLLAFSTFIVDTSGQGNVVTVTVLVALLVCLAPTTIGGLLSAIGIAGMNRLIKKNVIALSGQAIEAAGDIDVLLLDKTGTITLGNRQAVEFIPVDGHSVDQVAESAQLASVADETPEGRSVLVLAEGLNHQKSGIDEIISQYSPYNFIAFSAQTRMSGIDGKGISVRKGAPDMMYKFIQERGTAPSLELKLAVDKVAMSGGTPLVVVRDGKAVGVINLKDIVKNGIRERFAQLRKMGIRTVMITGDNKLTAAAIAAEAGVDDFLAEATPERKLELIRHYQSEGKTVAMTGDGTNDAPALAQADVAVAMNTGTQPAREAANMIDLDSNPTKLIEIVETGKQLLMTRGSLTTFSVTNDVAKYFVIIPAAFTSTYPVLDTLNFMGLENAILSAVIFNAIIIVMLIPLALRGVKYAPMSAEEALRKNILIYGLGGLVIPFIGIKAIDILLVLLGVQG